MKGGIDQERLFADVMTLASITEPDRPYTRRSFSSMFLRGREWLAEKFERAGLSVRLDAGANLIGRFEAGVPGAKAIVLGSHSDTVPSGGRFDGIAGVLTALEAFRGLRARGARLRRPVEIIDFLAEEPSEYGLSCVGSRAMAGALEPAMLGYKNASGETLADAMTRVGGDPARVAEARRDDIAGYFELHIEQGIVLESNRIDLGLVTAIVGIARIEIAFEGSADHAGTTPLPYRRDAGLAAAELMLFVRRQAEAFAARGQGHFVATVGVFEITPNAANVVPGGARMVIDMRSEHARSIGEFIELLDGESAAIAARGKVERKRFSILSRTSPSASDAHLLDLLSRGAAKLGHSTMPIVSGAGHDAAFISRIAPGAMLFIPCRGGKSHSPEEWAEPAAMAMGAATLLEAVLLFDASTAVEGDAQ